MPPYTLIASQHVLILFGVGLGLAIVIILARGSRYLGFSFRKTSPKELDETQHEFGGEVRESYNPVPWLIWLVFVGYFLWAMGYVLYCGRFGI